MWARSASLYILALLLFLPQNSLAIDFANCEAGFRFLADASFDSSVELEMLNSEAVMSILTTKTGKIGVLFDEIGESSAPSSLIAELGATSFKDLKMKDWDALNIDQKYDLLNHISSNKKTEFFTDRTFPGLKVRDEIQMTFDKETEFLGNTYLPGTYKVKLNGSMENVEYGNQDQRAAFLELHLRTRLPAGSVSRDAKTLQKAIGTKVTPQHVHIVAPIPIQKLKMSPHTQSIRMGEYYRRVNLVSEMLTITKQSGGIYAKTGEGIVYFDSLTAKKLKGVTKYFEDLAAGKNPEVGDQYKMAWVGLRGSDKYDQPGLYGYEFRNITAQGDPIEDEKLLNSIQWSINKDEYGISEQKISDWTNKYHPGKSPSDAVASTWYNQSFHSLYKQANPLVRENIGLWGRMSLWVSSNNKAVKMLLYDWTKDPILFDKPELSKKILEKQVDAIKKIRSDADPDEVLRDFLKESNLLEIFARSIGS